MVIRSSKLFLVTIIMWLLFTSLPALAAGGLDITFTPAKNELTVGDPVVLTLEINHPAGYQVIIPKLGQSWGDFEVRSQSQVETVANPDGSETTHQTIAVTLFAPGEFQTPPLALTVRNNMGQIGEETVPPVLFTVIPVLAEGDDTLLDIKPQAELQLPPYWPWLVAGLLGLTLLTLSIWWLRRQRQFGPALAVDTRSPYQVAFDQLSHIESLKLPEQGEFKEHYTLVTDCLRRYLEEQHRVRAFDRTTTELKASFKQSVLLPEYARRFLNLFSDSDLVKFAKFIPEFAQAHRLTTQARQLVDETRPLPELVTPPTASTSPNGRAAALPDSQVVSTSNHDLDLRKDARRWQ